MKVLFVCMGNICRSPAAENVMRHLLEEERLVGEWILDSAGTIGLHAGSFPDSRMARAGRRRGISFQGEARPVIPEDLDRFDLILVMDRENHSDLKSLGPSPDQWKKIRFFTEFCERHDEEEVPDPYYGGEDGFELVLDMMEDGCAGLLRRWKEDRLEPGR